MSEKQPHQVGMWTDPVPPDPPRYLVWFGIPPFAAAFLLSAFDPAAGAALLACLTIMTITLTVFARRQRRPAAGVAALAGRCRDGRHHRHIRDEAEG